MITDTCGCGAKLTISEKYGCEEHLQHNRWLDAHSVCRKLASISFIDIAKEVYTTVTHDDVIGLLCKEDLPTQ
jgi:hypothetical protein